MASPQTAAKVLVASNRGPVSYEVRDDGSLHSKRGGGGMVSGLSAIGTVGDAVQSSRIVPRVRKWIDKEGSPA